MWSWDFTASANQTAFNLNPMLGVDNLQATTALMIAPGVILICNDAHLPETPIGEVSPVCRHWPFLTDMMEPLERVLAAASLSNCNCLEPGEIKMQSFLTIRSASVSGHVRRLQVGNFSVNQSASS
jgi:hypothetical protein